MRPGQQNKRGRGRNSNNNRKGGNPLSRTYDSSGPDVKIRGTAQHVAEKYAALARDAQSSGDNVMAENYLQHAEHYNRVIAAAQAQMQERFQRDDRDGSDRDDDRDDGERASSERSDGYRGNGHDRGGGGHDRQSARGDDQTDGEERQESQSHVNGSGPQPVIDGMPAEVAIEDETPASGPRRTSTRRRGAASRPRRTRKSDAAASEGSEESGDEEGGKAPMAGASSE